MAIVGLVLAWLAMLLLGAGDVDRALLFELYAGRNQPLAAAALVMTFFGSGWFVTLASAVGALVLAIRKEMRAALVLLVATAVGKALVELQKYEIDRLRPDSFPHLVQVHNLSFPSGHSANAAMTYVLLAFLLTRAGTARRVAVSAALVVTALIGLSRVMLGVHWPSDVVGGWAFGLLWAMLALSLAKPGRT
ncbi:MAG TPA: phosphatase PAP2 family protein [Sphingomicrobium sp.]|nr:phosphatase PAP2 family protein [Sphingomicrobium sp.]